MRECIVIGHKGAAGHAPENTLLSYAKAVEIGAQMIELDVHATLDNQIVCIHDERVDRTTDGVGAVSAMTYNEIKALNAGNNERIPLLSEVLDFAHDKIDVNVEIKALGIESRIADLIVSRKMIDNVLVSSFYHGALVTIKELNPDIRTAVLVGVQQQDLIPYALELDSIAINPRYTLVTQSLVKEAHQNKLKVYPWTVNDSSEMLDLLRKRVDGIITDYPDVALQIVRNHED